MRGFDNDTLTMVPLASSGWDPACFLTPEAMRYFMPGLIRVQLDALCQDPGSGYRSFDILSFHMNDANRDKFAQLTADEIGFVAELFDALLACPGFDLFFGFDAETIRGASARWRDRAGWPSR
jgi:hypothetical protein